MNFLTTVTSQKNNLIKLPINITIRITLINPGAQLQAPRGRPKSNPSSSHSSSPKRTARSPRFQDESGNPASSVQQTRGSSLRNPTGSPAHKIPEPSASNHGRVMSRSRSPNGTPRRIRKGCGFTDQYSFTWRYRTPSPELSPHRFYHYGGRNIHERKHDRYSNYRSYSDCSPERRYRSQARGRCPARASQPEDEDEDENEDVLKKN